MAHSPDSRQRDDSAFLIHCLINDAPQLIMPYLSPILKVGGVMVENGGTVRGMEVGNEGGKV
jgi:hypothetical protein